MQAMSLRNCRFWASIVALGAFLAVGCTTTRVATVSRMEPPTTQRSQPVRYDGEYVAMWTPSDKKHLQPIPGGTVTANKGDRLGFARADDGRLLALYGEQSFPLQHKPADRGYVVWRHQSVRQTQFGREMDKVGEGTAEVLKATGTVALFVGLIALDAATSPEDCDDDDDDSFITFGKSEHHHHDRDHHGKKGENKKND